MPTASVRALITGLVDYAGLFPPAKLDMASAASAFSRHRESPQSFALSRFICPVSRLGEFAKAALPHLPNVDAVPLEAAKGKAKAVAAVVAERAKTIDPASPEAHLMPWTISALIDGPLEGNLKVIEEFNAAHYRNHHHSAVIDTVEIKVANPDSIDAAIEILPEEFLPFFEIPLNGDVRAFAAALAGTGAAAKMRTGGVTPDMFPTIEQVADFLMVMADGKIPFKATAGLHHPLRAAHPLTYEKGCASATMHGFVNLFLAAALVHDQDIDRETVMHLLGETVADRFSFTAFDAEWRGLKIPVAGIRAAREDFALCFGSCSFDDPTKELAGLGWL